MPSAFQALQVPFLHVPEVLNMSPDKSVHFFRLLQARNVCTVCSSKSVLQTCIKNMLKLRTLILTMVFLNVTLPVMFSMTKLLKNQPCYLENIIVRFFIFTINFSFNFCFFHSHIASLTIGLKFSTFKVFEHLVLNTSKILYSY